jgi:DNA-binding MarR family transcriptional regulator
MAGEIQRPAVEHDKIILGLLESVERDGGQSQRRLASELGIALGLVNAYVKRCVKKGFVKVRTAPTRRYAYYLTPQGFAEKSRLTVEYLSHSFSFFRQARVECGKVLAQARKQGWSRIVLAGVSDLAEIARICALEEAIEIVSVVDPNASVASFVGLPVVASLDAVQGSFDAVVVTDLRAARQMYDYAAKRVAADRILVPSLLGLVIIPAQDKAS